MSFLFGTTPSSSDTSKDTKSEEKSKEKKSDITWFKVDHEVSLGTALTGLGSTALSDAWKKHGKIEAYSSQPKDLVRVFSEQNLLAEAVHQAFYKHFPLILSPDIIWLTIAQGFAYHVAQDPEGMRKHFVDFKGKKKLTISRPEFIKGSPLNDWTTVFPEFSDKISTFIGKETVDLVTCNFSTTGPCERIVSQITLMDTVQHYFEYEMMCGCGIPSIGLKGTIEDWKNIRLKTEKLKNFGLDWWLKELLPVLDHFILASQGKPDKKFWRAICNYTGASGLPGDPITGWLQVFYPYLNASGSSWDLRRGKNSDSKTKPKMRKNESGISQYHTSVTSGITAATYKRGGFGDETGCGYGIELEDIPPSICSAPFTYVDLTSELSYQMAFMGGIVSLVQHSGTRALEPLVGWAVIDQSA